ncbi:MAG: hypothetical protein M3367_18635 [Acidobacteriota bacterium]|nr:hypothetical protein [Acidobacteriota bacterium]
MTKNIFTTARCDTATLTVTHNNGATSSSSVGISVQAQPTSNNMIFVNNISMSITTNRRGRAVVLVYDNNGAWRPNVTRREIEAA